MREGVARDGSHLFPAFPLDHFTRLSDDDVRALYATSRAPVRASAQANTIPFPLNIRYLQAGWKLLFFHPGRFEPDPNKSAEWNRGAYLAEGLSHCGACHTPRNLLGAERPSAAYTGAVVDDWIAPPLTAAKSFPRAMDARGAAKLFAPWSKRSSRDSGGADVSRSARSRPSARLTRLTAAGEPLHAPVRAGVEEART